MDNNNNGRIDIFHIKTFAFTERNSYGEYTNNNVIEYFEFNTKGEMEQFISKIDWNKTHNIEVIRSTHSKVKSTN